MRLKNIKISAQLVIGFAIVLIIFFALGAVAYIEASTIHNEMETLYEHPLTVRNAINEIKSDAYMIHWGFETAFRQDDYQQMAPYIEIVRGLDTNVQNNISILYTYYLGPKEDIDQLAALVNECRANREDVIRLLQAGDFEQATLINEQGSTAISSEHFKKITSSIEKISAFAENKANELYAASEASITSLQKELIILFSVFLIITFTISFLLIRNIRKPLTVLTDAARRFHEGDLNARSTYFLMNEFGILSASFNTMVNTIQTNMTLNKNAAELAGIMLSEEDARAFFSLTLGALAKHTGAQVAAVYLLSHDKKAFEHFESIGMDGSARGSFDVRGFEGEFGAVLSSRKIQYINEIPDDTRFVFPVAGGRFIPREIITIPILNNDEVIAMISLACISKFNEHSIELIDSVIGTMSARIEGILAFRTIKEYKEVLEQQNRELDAQKGELVEQATELTQQNVELETQKNQLKEASMLKTSFLSNMSHELRTPLNSVIALSGVLSRRLANAIPGEEHSYLEIIERNGKILLNLINDILDISRIEAGREEIEVAEFNVNSIIADAVDLIKPQADQKKVALNHVINEAEISITSDSDKLRHILHNLIGNAVKFTEKGKVEVSAARNDDKIEIKVTDTGIGIDKEHLPYIFDEFRQADGGTARRYGGAGLGLSIAKKYANMLGGTLSVVSTPGEGSVFTLLLPLQYTSESGIAETDASAGLTRKHKQAIHAATDISDKIILLVEDSEPAIIQVKDLMEAEGYKIHVARNVDEAFESIGKAVPDAIILDLMMPDIDGFELLKTIREKESTVHIPVLILTAKHITKEELRFLKSNHVHQLIQKGDVNRTELLNAVATMVFPVPQEDMKPPRKRKVIKEKPVILVVEDNMDNLTTVKALLADRFNILEAVDGNQAIEIAEEQVPDLVLMDISLPGKDGIEAFKTIRKCPASRHIPVVALTASAMIQERETILAYGFDAYIPKPIIAKECFEVIDEVLYGK